jgi:2-polyprenyl-3-methyl-5-hydroxy-6-metoxy-1,4-benzoquinol methylase
VSEADCPLCGGHTEAFLTRLDVPVHQNLAHFSREAARNTARGDLALRVCHGCGFVFNQAFDEGRMGYGDAYQNEQTLSPAFSAHVDARVAALAATLAPGGRIVEVGCGKGEFLRRLVQAAPPGVTGTGYDTTYAGPPSLLDGRLRFERRYYGPACADEPVDVVVCRHVIEHVPRPRDLLHGVRQALAASPGARLYFETPCVEWILSHGVIWDFFYEHCSYFTAASLAWAFAAEGFAVQAVGHVFGGQYLWLEATLADAPSPATPAAGGIPDLAHAFATAEAQQRDEWLRRLTAWRQDGPVALWGAGGKGATLANLVDPDATLIDCLIDVNPAKAGTFVPGTGHAIVGYEAITPRRLRRAVMMNPNYRAENQARLDADGIPLELVE